MSSVTPPVRAQAWDKLGPNGTRTTAEGQSMQVREGMSSVVLAVGPGHTLRETASKMTEKGTGAALVFDEESPAPRIITERDILTAIGEGQDPDREKVADHMSDSVISAGPDWSLERA